MTHDVGIDHVYLPRYFHLSYTPMQNCATLAKCG